MEDTPKLTPMFEQYRLIKANYPDALLFYRMGDFYELFFEDAKIASRELQIALTSRNKLQGRDVPMCGVPWHAARGYIAELLERGYVVAICEQVEDAKASKGLVKREVTQVITPGTVLDEQNLIATSHNFLGCIVADKDASDYAFVWADLSTSQWTGCTYSKAEDLWAWVTKMAPREILLPKDLPLPASDVCRKAHLAYHKKLPQVAKAASLLCQVQKVQSLEALGLDKKPLLAQACAALLLYVEETQKVATDQFKPFQPINLSKRMLIDDVTERNLEIFVRLNGQKGPGTLRQILEQTKTPMGGRLLEEMLHHPWRDQEIILRIQSAVDFFFQDDALRLALRQILDQIYDLERLTQRIALNRFQPKDFLALKNSLLLLPEIKTLLSDKLATNPNPVLDELLSNWDVLDNYAEILSQALVADPPPTITDGGLFLPGYNQELDELLDMVDHAEQKLQNLLEQEKTTTGIAKLKMGYNRVFGYYYEISKACEVKVPEHFVRRQTLANAERFTTQSLKDLEEKLLTASDQRKNLEYHLFLELRSILASASSRFLAMSDILANLDYWQALAEVARLNNWVKPTFSPKDDLEIVNGRHPVVEAMLGATNFVPNSLSLKLGRNFCLLTGPNMAGKSTVLRQTALICLLAQMGSFVPATKAHLGLVDRLFSRVGASDNLAQGQSTFMVEMMETAKILRQATKKSLIILDEIGRGTSTYDGVALAWAIVEYLLKRSGGSPRTIFATHYHELTALEGRLAELFTMNIAISEVNNTMVFLHKLIPGPADRSYGVEVARLSGIPTPVIQRAKELLQNLEAGRRGMETAVQEAAQMLLPGLDSPKKPLEEKEQPQEIHPLVQAIAQIEPDNLSPLEALNILIDWKRRWGQDSQDLKAMKSRKQKSSS